MDGLIPVTLDCSCQLIASDGCWSMQLIPTTNGRGNSPTRLNKLLLICCEAYPSLLWHMHDVWDSYVLGLKM